MTIKAVQFATLLLAALALTMESAHVLELPQKMQYDAAFYAAVNGTLYRHFATVGAVYELGSIVAACVLAWLVRGQPSTFRWTLAGAGPLLAAFALWLAVVAPVNAEVAATLRDAPATVPALWMELRPRWEYGHPAGFVAQLAGFCGLLVSVLVSPDRRSAATGRAPATTR